jgi:hypothetical protein
MKKALIISVLLNVLTLGFFAGKRLYYSYGATKAPVIQPVKSNVETKTSHHIDSSKIGKVKNILILGNSIVRHGPLPEIGWVNNWGMAASAKDSDFVHLLIRSIKQKDSKATVMFENIASFERDFDSYNLDQAKEFRNFGPDLIVMRINENVNADKAISKGFLKYYDSLINYIDPNKRAIKVIVGGFWPNNAVTRMLNDYAYLKGYAFIDQSMLSDSTTKAIGQWKDPGIQEHPNNLGMLKIKESIWATISPYFLSNIVDNHPLTPVTKTVTAP